jgi:hypothetical protein
MFAFGIPADEFLSDVSSHLDRSARSAGDDLVPGADPYIRFLMARHEAEGRRLDTAEAHGDGHKLGA